MQSLSSNNIFSITGSGKQFNEPSRGTDITPVAYECVNEVKTKAMDLYEDLSNKKLGFVSRNSQKDIIKACASANYHKQTLVAQAGTGIGKTMSYVLGALPLLSQKNTKLVISTYTVALQTQLEEKDLPELIAHLAPELTFEVAKGAGHYYCPVRATNALASTMNVDTEQNQDFFSDIDEQAQISSDEKRTINGLQNDFINNIFDGDLDKSVRPLNSKVISTVNRNVNHCPGNKKCNKSDVCPFYIQRKKVQLANIVITNHALLSRTTLGGHSTFSERGFGDNLLVIDEGHRFPSVLRDANEAGFSLGRFTKLLKKPAAMLKKTTKFVGFSQLTGQHNEAQSLKSEISSLVGGCERASKRVLALNDFLKNNFNVLRGEVKQFDDKDAWVMPPSSMNTTLATLIKECTLELSSVYGVLNAVCKKNNESSETYFNDSSNKADKFKQTMVMNLHTLKQEVNNALTCLTYYTSFAEIQEQKAKVESGVARWITRTESKQDGTNFELHGNLLNVGFCFQEYFAKEYYSVVLTSATLERLGSCNGFLNELAIDKRQPNNVVKLFSSPFNYNNTQLSAPIRSGNPNAPQHNKVVANQLMPLMARHKAILVLFTSKKALENTYELCPPAIKNLILRQHSHSKSELIKQHKANVDNGSTSILFGVDGLSEGVDLPEHYLTCVVITKLPFPLLSAPLFKYETMCLEAKNESAFIKQMLPLCSQKLIQSAGRLIRSEKDHGEVVILDSRVNTQRYGAQLLQCLPMYKAPAFQFER